jgi:hypothetical protein
MRSDERGSAFCGRSSFAAALFEVIAGLEVGAHENVGTDEGEARHLHGDRYRPVRHVAHLAKVSYHGRIYIDQASHEVKSLTMITDEQPKKFPIRKAAIRVDYDYVAINDHDYILPVSAQVVTRMSGDLLKRNDLTFSNFRRFGSTARIVGTAAAVVPQ